MCKMHTFVKLEFKYFCLHILNIWNFSVSQYLRYKEQHLELFSTLDGMPPLPLRSASRCRYGIPRNNKQDLRIFWNDMDRLRHWAYLLKLSTINVWAVTITHSLTRSWRWAILEKLPIVQPLKNFPAFYGTRRFITAFTRALHWSLPWARSIQSIPSHPV
jgi:hypothetical protein